jgi:erythromycin esterase
VACGLRRADPPADASPIHPISAAKPYKVADYRFLGPLVGSRSIVQLGESIHVTQEFPLARLNVVRYLHEELGFDVLALEGSSLAAWLAADHLRTSSDSDVAKATRAQQLAWFALWQTEPMLKLMDYILSTQKTAHPLYLASFDIQPGTSRAFGGSPTAALQAFYAAVGSYAPESVKPESEQQWTKALLPFLNCYKDRSPRNPLMKTDAERATNSIETWLESIVPVVTRQTSAAHAQALLLVPSTLKQDIALCEAVTAPNAPPSAYTETRDQLNAQNVLTLRQSISANHRVIVWAHHSHITYNSSGTNIASMGQHLHHAAGNELYTIGLFAGRGSATQVDDSSLLPVVPRKLRPLSFYPVENGLANLSQGDFFVDFLSAAQPPSWWSRPAYSRLETKGAQKTVLAKDYDAAIFLHTVHPADLTFMPPLIRRGLWLCGFFLDNLWIWISLALLAILFAARKFFRNPSSPPAKAR